MGEPGDAASVEGATSPLREVTGRSTDAPSPADVVRLVDLQGAPDEQAVLALVAAERARLELEDVLESMSDAFYAYDHEWHLLRINRAGREIFRGGSVDPAAALGKVIWDVMPAIRNGPMADAMLRCARERAPVRVEARAPYTGRWLEVNVYPTAQGVAAYTHDISSRKKAEAAQRLLADAGALLSSALDPRRDPRAGGAPRRAGARRLVRAPPAGGGRPAPGRGDPACGP